MVPLIEREFADAIKFTSETAFRKQAHEAAFDRLTPSHNNYQNTEFYSAFLKEIKSYQPTAVSRALNDALLVLVEFREIS